MSEIPHRPGGRESANETDDDDRGGTTSTTNSNSNHDQISEEERKALTHNYMLESKLLESQRQLNMMLSGESESAHISEDMVLTSTVLFRSQHVEQRLKAAYWSATVARAAALTHKDNDLLCRLRHDIQSSGGVHALLRLFHGLATRRASLPLCRQLKVVSALGVAYLLPSVPEGSMSLGTHTSLGWEIMDCLVFLTTVGNIECEGETLWAQDSFDAAAMGLAAFWMYQVAPALPMGNFQQEDLFGDGASPTLAERSIGIERDDFVKTTVSLAVHTLQKTFERGGEGIPYALLIERICVVPAARELAISGGGVLPVIIHFVHAGDPQDLRHAVISLGHLSSLDDRLTVGWILSQLMEKGALHAIIRLTAIPSLDPSLRLAVVHLLSLYCEMPQIPNPILEQPTCIQVLVEALFDYSEAKETAIFAGKALLKLLSSAFVERSPVDDIIVALSIVEDRSELQSIAIEIFYILSDYESPSLTFRERLHKCGATRSLGNALKLMVAEWKALTSISNEYPLSIAKESYQATRALLNMFLSLPDNVLAEAFRQIVESGGVEALVWFASRSPTNSSSMYLVGESCRALVTFSPMIISHEFAEEGVLKWAVDILDAFYSTLKYLSGENKLAAADGYAASLLNSVVKGIAVLAKSTPLQLRIVHRILPYLLEVKGSCENAAIHAMAPLKLPADEINLQLFDDNKNLTIDWFCLQRSLFVQALAREEIRKSVLSRWDLPCDGRTPQVGSDLFGIIKDDNQSSGINESIARQYKEMYLGRVTQLSNDMALENGSALRHQTYPLDDSMNEISWILKHCQFLDHNGCTDIVSNVLSGHVVDLMDRCMPSQLLRDDVLPVTMLAPESSFDFRAFTMPQRRYASFHQEAQLLRWAFDGMDSSLTDAHWTIAFTNSSFEGDFAESLVQSLYLCSAIQGLSFAKIPSTNPSDQESTSGDSDDGSFFANFQERSFPRSSSTTKASEADIWGAKQTITERDNQTLTKLVALLPPWISHLTFEGVLKEYDLKMLVQAVEGTEEPSGEEGASVAETIRDGRLRFFAVRKSANVSNEVWRSLFSLLKRVGDIRQSPQCRAFSSLKSLDLSWNGMGDQLCAEVLRLVLHEHDCACAIEKLDLSGNFINSGIEVSKTIRDHGKISKRAPLNTLRLSSNSLYMGRAWVDIINLVMKKALQLKLLDLSANNLSPRYEDLSSLLMALLGTSLFHLDFSNNSFRPEIIENLFNQMETTEKPPSFGFLNFASNNPELSETQIGIWRTVSRKSREAALQRALASKRAPSLTRQFPLVNDIGTLLPNSNKEIEETPIGYTRNNGITVMFSAPLIYRVGEAKLLHPFVQLDLPMEREYIWQCMKETSRDITLRFDTAHHDRFIAAATAECKVLHYSGHGHQKYLPLEDDSGGPAWKQVDDIRELIVGDGKVPFRCVFVSACFSESIGRTFASAGVPHVICCRHDSELNDLAALAFTRQFYRAIALGCTVIDAFDKGRKAVRASPKIRDPTREVNKFLLLPVDGDHNVRIFNAKPVRVWPTDDGETTSESIGKKLGMWNMIQQHNIPSLPEFFLGREIDMYHVLQLILGARKRLVSILGEKGVGRSSLARGLCHYINERSSIMKHLIDQILFIKIQERRKNRMRGLVEQLIAKADGLITTPSPSQEHLSTERLCDIAFDRLKHSKALVVIDRVWLLQDSEDDKEELVFFLEQLLFETSRVRVLLTSRSELGVPSIGGCVEHPYPLGPLNLENSLYLFARSCRHIKMRAEEAKLAGRFLSNDTPPPSPGSETQKLYDRYLGSGWPSKIVESAYNISKENFANLMSGRV